MNTSTLPDRPDLDQLRRQAKDLLAAYRKGDDTATTQVKTHYRAPNLATFALHDAQLVIARSYGFDSWPKLKAHVDGVTVQRLVDTVKANDLDAARAMLKVRPELATMDLHEHDEHQALHYAVLARNPAMVRLLMQYGANARKGVYPHRDATSAFTIATERGFADIVAVIEDEERKSPLTRPYGDAARSKPIPPELADAARRNDQDAIVAYLEAHPDLMHEVEYLLTPLHRASMMLWDRVAAWLLDHGADVNARIDGGPSPVEIAGCGFGPPYDGTQARVLEMAALLRSRGAEFTPRAAVAYGDLDALRTLHAAGKLANHLPKNQGLRGFLEIAILHNQPAALALLLDLGFDPDEPIQVGDTTEYRRHGPLTMCVRTGRFEMAEPLLAHGATLTPWAAVVLEKKDWLRAQHEAGTLMNTVDEYEGGLVSTAVKHEAPEMLEFLLALGLGEAAFESGAPLIHCAGHGEHKMAEILLKYGADPNQPPGTALFEAFRARDTAMVDLLKRYGGVVTPETPGYWRDIELAREILSTDPSNQSAEDMLDGAATGGSPELLAMVLDRITWDRADGRWFGILRSAIVMWHEIPWIKQQAHRDWHPDRSTYLDCLRLLLTRADPDVRGIHGLTALHEVAGLGDWATDAEVAAFAQALLDAGARTDLRDEMLHSTPLGWACRYGRLGMVKLLLDRGADPVEGDVEPWATPRSWAAKMGHQAVLAILPA